MRSDVRALGAESDDWGEDEACRKNRQQWVEHKIHPGF